MLVLANEMFDSPPVFAWVLPVFVRLQPGKEETFFSASRSRIFCFSHVEASSNDEGAWWEGPGQAGQGQGQGQGQGASKAKSSVLSQLSGLENVVFNDFIDDELDSEDLSEQRASASLPDSVPIESEEERAAREADEMAALDAVGDYEADPNVMLEDVPQDIVIKTLKVSCACVPVLVFACVCVYVRARDVDMCS